MANSSHPKTLAEAVRRLRRIIPTEKLDQFKQKERFGATLWDHFGIGMWIRNNFGLWEKDSPLFKAIGRNYFGAYDADSVSSIILGALHDTLNGKKPPICHIRTAVQEYYYELTGRKKRKPIIKTVRRNKIKRLFFT